MISNYIRQRYHYLALLAVTLLAGATAFYAWPIVASALEDWVYIDTTTPSREEARLPVVASSYVPAPVIARIPLSYKLNVPYTSQAPYRQWGQDTYENGCEEASLLMAHGYWQKQGIDADIATEAIGNMVKWQKENWGEHRDITVWELAEFADKYYGPIYQNKIYNNPTEEELKKELSAGRPVIIPVMSHSLGNPYYGPNDAYHMLILIGYDEGGFISNDPGVNPGQGKDYRYAYEVLDGAMGAQIGRIAGQGKVALVVYPK